MSKNQLSDEFEMKDLSVAQKILGMEIHRDLHSLRKKRSTSHVPCSSVVGSMMYAMVIVCDLDLDKGNVCDLDLDKGNVCDLDLDEGNVCDLDLDEGNVCDLDLDEGNVCDLNLDKETICNLDLDKGNACDLDLDKGNVYDLDLDEGNVCDLNVDKGDVYNQRILIWTKGNQGLLILENELLPAKDIGMAVGMVFLLWSMNVFTKAVGLGNSSCSGAAAVCGNVSIPFPFGIEPGCYINDSFAIDCKTTLGSPKPFLRRLDLEVLDISLEGTLRVNYPMSWWCPKSGTKNVNWSAANVSLASSPFFFSKSRNIFIAMGCGNWAFLQSGDSTVGGCVSVCAKDTKKTYGSSCNGIDCCKSTIASDLDVFTAVISGKLLGFSNASDCNYGSLVDQMWFEENLTNHFEVKKKSPVPVVLNWEINESLSSLVMESNSSHSTCQFANSSSSLLGNMSMTFTCTCDSGFEGNPYLLDGCQDIDECLDPRSCSFSYLRYGYHVPGKYYCVSVSAFVSDRKSRNKIIVIGISTGITGLLFLFIGGWWSYKVIKKRKNIKRKEKFFKRNGGLLLQQQLSSNQVTVEKTTKLFNSKDLEKATDNFNVNRILGQGGQGTVYKGMLTDGKIVAIKKSKVIDEGKLEEFVNEIVILSQINHRNVVKLLGCCLEIEVPLLVYEFIPNGTLYQYLYDQNEEFPATWDMRLRIAIEVAGALFYLHSVASTPIYHRDIKTTNILLDDKYRAKIADFGTSRSITVDQTHLTTVVQGTFGYLDPEYFQSSQFTEKSDGYSFGVVLIELLTGEKAISSTRTKECRSLATYFIHSMEEKNLFNIIDARVMKDAKQEEIIAVANLAKMCLNMKGKKRPTMKEVAMQLEAVQTLQKTPNVQQNHEEIEYAKTEMYEQWDAVSTSTMSGANSGVASSSSSCPLLSF
ncbi:wall-associated receptor kinase-like 3 [Castanea sativa]|uniref:wall-associated receptor kinase-like 3 n=1 Tax=Castanea sativa TaxID=21020 RepID=UPI003F64D3FE